MDQQNFMANSEGGRAIGFARRKDVKSGGTPVVEWGNGAAKTIEFCAFSKGNLLAPSMG